MSSILYWFLPHFIKEPYEWYILKKRTDYDNLLMILTFLKKNYKLTNEQLFRKVLEMKVQNLKIFKFSQRRFDIVIGYTDHKYMYIWKGFAIRSPSTGKISILMKA